MDILPCNRRQKGLHEYLYLPPIKPESVRQALRDKVTLPVNDRAKDDEEDRYVPISKWLKSVKEK